MNYDKNKYLSSPSKREAIYNYRQANKKKFIVGSGSPKHKHNHPPSFGRQDYFVKDLNQYQLCPHTNQHQENIAFQMNPKLFTLIHEAISSADKVAKQILRYDYPNLQVFCSNYFLSKQKLYSYIHGESMFQDQHYIVKMVKNKYKKQSSSDELTEVVPLNQLERLEKIVYNKVLPLLKLELDSQKKKFMKKKKNKEQVNTQLQQGLNLLQRLNDTKDKLGLEECIQVLQKFIIKSINRQEKLSGKVAKLQQKYETEIQQKEHLITQLRRKEEISLKSIGDMEKHMRQVDKYEQFVSELKGVLGQKQKSGSQIEGKDKFKDIIKRIKNIISNQEYAKRQRRHCQHRQQKSQRQLHSHCRQENIRHEEQAAKLKETIKKLTIQIEQLKIESEELEERLSKNSQKLNKLQNKSKKIVTENEMCNENIDRLTQDLKNKNNEIGEYSEMINKLQQNIRIQQEDYKALLQENEKNLELINKKQQQNEKLMTHILQIEQKNKSLQQMLQKNQKQVQELFKTIYMKQFQLKELNNILQKYGSQINQLNLNLGQKHQVIALLERNNNETRQYYEQKLKEQQLKNLPLWQKHLNYQIEQKGSSAALSREKQSQQPATRQEVDRQVEQIPQKQVLGNIYTKQYNQKQENKFDNPQTILALKQQKNGKKSQKQQEKQHLLQKFYMMEAKINEDKIDNNECLRPYQNKREEQQSGIQKKKLSDEEEASQIQMFKNIARSDSVKQKTVIIVYQNISQGEIIQNKEIEPLNPRTLQEEMNQIEQDQLIKQIKQPQFHLESQPLPDQIDNIFNNKVEPRSRKEINQQIQNQIASKQKQQEFARPIDNQFIGREDPTPNRGDFIPENINKIPPSLQNKPNQCQTILPNQIAKPIDNQFIQIIPPTPNRPDFIPRNINVVPPQSGQQNQFAKPIDNQFIQIIPPSPNRPDFIPTAINKNKGEQEKDNLDTVQKSEQSVDRVITEKINESQTVRPQNITKAEQPLYIEGGNIMGIDSDKDKKSTEKAEQLIKIQDNQLNNPQEQQIQDNYLINIDTVQQNQNKVLQQFYLFPELEQHFRIKQIIQINNNIKKYSTKLQERLNAELTQLNQMNKEIQKMQILLQLYKKSIINKLAKYNKVQIINKQGDGEQNTIKDKLQVNNIKKQLISNIKSDSQASVFTIPEHLQELMRQRSHLYQHKIETALSMDQYARTQRGIQTETFKLKRKQPLIESDVRKYFPEMYQLIQPQEQAHQELDQSFIDDLDSINAIDPIRLNSHQIQRIQSMLSQFDPLLISLNIQNRNPAQKISEQDLKKSRIRLENSIREIGNLIQYHRKQILHLHNLFKRTVSIPKIANSQPLPHTPIKRPLQNEQYLAHIMAAPQKSVHEDTPNQQLLKESEQKEKEANEQRVLKHKCSQKRQQINDSNGNLNTIINKLKENGQVSNLQQQRRNNDQNNNEYERLKAQFIQLERVNKKLKNQIYKLNLIIKQTQQAEIQQQNIVSQQVVITPFRDDSQGLEISQIKPIEVNGNLLLQSKQLGNKIKAIRSKNNKVNHIENGTELKEISEAYNLDQKNKESNPFISKSNIIPQIELSPEYNQENKRYQRKTEKFIKQGQQLKKVQPKKGLDFGWQDLLPQYFTKSNTSKNRSQNKK